MHRPDVIHNLTPITRDAGTLMPTVASSITPCPVVSHSDDNLPIAMGYEFLSVIGSGGMGVVYKAKHRELHRTVAIKMLRGAAVHETEFLERFKEEAEAVARLQHPNIIQVFEVGKAIQPKGESVSLPFIVLEYVSGGSLFQKTDRPQDPKYAAEIVEKLARGVHSAHCLGIVHRDLKPANVLLTETGEPKIADFGLAKQMGGGKDGCGRFLTLPGMVVGTPEYMAPEQAKGEIPTPAMDIYALGVILYELLTGKVPFHAATPMETFMMAFKATPDSPRLLQPSLARDLETICLKCLEKLPKNRYATAELLAEDLRRFLEHRPIQARHISEVEKFARWCRRSPVVAGLLMSFVVMFFTAFLLVAGSYFRAEQALEQEAFHRLEAERQQQAERLEHYRANIVAAGMALQVHNISAARRTLTDTPDEFRNWEWRHFMSRLDMAQRVQNIPTQIDHFSLLWTGSDHLGLLTAEKTVQVWNASETKLVGEFKNPDHQNHIVISPDGASTAQVVGAICVEIRDTESGRLRTTLRGHDKIVCNLAFTADGGRVITAADDLTIRLWDAKNGACLRVISTRANPTAEIGKRTYRSSVFNIPKMLAIHTRNEDTHISIWNLETGLEVSRIPLATNVLISEKLSFDEKRLVTTEAFPTFRVSLWDVTTGKLIAEMGSHNNFVREIAFSPDGTRIATCSLDQTIALWDGVSGKLISRCLGHTNRVIHVQFSRDSQQFASASMDHTIRLWNAADGVEQAVLTGHTAAVMKVDYQRDGRTLISSANDQTFRVWDVKKAVEDGVLRGHTSFVYSAAFHPDGERVVSGSWDGTVRVWNATTGQQIHLLRKRKDIIVSSVAVSPDGKWIAARGRGYIWIWDLESGKFLKEFVASSDQWRDNRLSFSPDSKTLATATNDHQVRLWDMHTLTESQPLLGHKDSIKDVAFHPDGRTLTSVSMGLDNTIRVWDLATRRCVQEIHHDGPGEFYAVAYNRDGKYLAASASSGIVRIWNTETWAEIGLLKNGIDTYGVAFSPDNSRIACACADNTIRLWDSKARHEVAELRGHKDYVHQIAFSPDGTRLVSASGDMTIRIWDTLKPQERAKLKPITGQK